MRWQLLIIDTYKQIHILLYVQHEATIGNCMSCHLIQKPASFWPYWRYETWSWTLKTHTCRLANEMSRWSFPELGFRRCTPSKVVCRYVGWLLQAHVWLPLLAVKSSSFSNCQTMEWAQMLWTPQVNSFLTRLHVSCDSSCSFHLAKVLLAVRSLSADMLLCACFLHSIYINRNPILYSVGFLVMIHCWHLGIFLFIWVPISLLGNWIVHFQSWLEQNFAMKRFYLYLSQI